MITHSPNHDHLRRLYLDSVAKKEMRHSVNAARAILAFLLVTIGAGIAFAVAHFSH